jgi:hypothetical protein
MTRTRFDRIDPRGLGALVPAAPARMSFRTAIRSLRPLAFVGLAQLALFLSCGPLGELVLRRASDDGPARVGQARDRAELLATVAFAQWLMSHPGETCPGSIDDVSLYVGADSRDPWKSRMETICRTDGGFGVVSAGPDGSFDTADDIHSWDPAPYEHR